MVTMAPLARSWMWLCLAGVLALLLSGHTAAAFKANEFKTCDKSSFCQRLRAKPPRSKYVLSGDTLVVSESGSVHGKIAVVDLPGVPHNDANGTEEAPARAPLHSEIDFALFAYDSGVVRVKLSQPGRFEVPEVLVESLDPVELVPVRKVENGEVFRFLGRNNMQVELRFDPIRVEVFRDRSVSSEPTIVFNENSLLAFERQQAADATCDWSETFLSHKDGRKHGPMGLSVDVHFPGAAHVYGIPERATRFALKPTRFVAENGDEPRLEEPYRLYNLDVFEYLADHPFGLYGSIPFLTAQQPGQTAGAFWLNAAEMYVLSTLPLLPTPSRFPFTFPGTRAP